MATTLVANGAVYDDFRGLSVGTALSGRTSDSGHTWVQHLRTWEVQDTPNPVGHGEGNRAGATGLQYAQLGIDFGSADVEIEAFMHRPDASSNAGSLMLRRTSVGMYTLNISATSMSLRTFIHSTEAIAVLDSVSVSALNKSVIKIVASGSTIDCYLDDVLEMSVVDSTYSGTTHGMFQHFTGSTNWGFYAFNMHPSGAEGWTVGSIRF